MKGSRISGLQAAAVLACIAGTVAAKCPDQEVIPAEPRSIDDTFGRVSSRWVDSQVGWPWSRPVVVGDVAIFATGDQQLIARDKTTGARRWATRITSVNGVGFIQGLNLIARGGVVVAAVSRNTVGVDIATGKQLWSYGAPTDTLLDPPGVSATVAGVELDADDSTVFIPAWGASVSAVDIRSGQARWVWRTPSGTEYRVGAQGARVSGDTLFATIWHDVNSQGNLSEGWLVALDRFDGRQLSRAIIPPYTSRIFLNGRPELWRNLIVLTGRGGRVWAYNRATLEQAWQYQPAQATGTTLTGPELFDGFLYCDGGDEHIIALRADDGSLVWRTRVMSQATTTLLATNARVYIPEGQFLNVLDRSSGHYVARTRQPGATYTSGGLFATPATSSERQIFITVDKGAWSFDEP